MQIKELTSLVKKKNYEFFDSISRKDKFIFGYDKKKKKSILLKSMKKKLITCALVIMLQRNTNYSKTLQGRAIKHLIGMPLLTIVF